MSRTLKVFFACALGGGIGAMIALQLGGYLWWIGMIIGALIGYLSYEFKAVVAAPGLAWRKTMACRLDRQKVRRQFNKALWMILLLGNLFATAILYLAIPDPLIKSYFPFTAKFFLFSMPLFIIVAPMILGNIWLTDKLAQGDEAKDLKFTILLTNPLFLLTLGTASFLYLTIIFLKGTIFPFGKMVFLQIHSEIRLLCFFDAGIGAAVGYFAGHALIGAIAGGILGVLNYELVSKRLLKLVPAKF